MTAIKFPSFIDDQFAPRSTIKLKRELQFSSYKISQVVSLQQLKQIGHEFKNCLKENYGDENLTGGFSSFLSLDMMKNHPETLFLS